jgi:asparagine synthase (glutamine-hydrolysing)
LLSYLKNGSVQDPDTLVDGVYSLPAGSWLRWKDGSVETSEFWKREFRSERVPDRTQCIQLTRDALLESVDRHFVSDVPVGIFLSGGLDSTALVALATKLGKKDIHTFCIAFDDAEYNEGEIARRTAKHFGTVHHEWRLGAEEARSLLDEFLNSIDQPSIDGFNTYCVSRFASRCGMKVVLSGLGGDELFGSYPSFQLIPRMMQWYQRLRFPLLRKLVGNALRLTRPYSNFERMGRFLLSEGKCDAAYEIVRSVYSDEDARKLSDMYLPRSVTNDEMHVCETAVDEPIPEVAENISYLELNRYMLNQLLRDSDVMSMANGLELRVPFLDVMLFKTLAKVSPEIRFTPNKELLLRSVPEIPDWVSNQPKRGFTVPFVHWFGEEWKREFANCHEGRPTLGTKWYHDWSLFVLDQYLVRNLFR